MAEGDFVRKYLKAHRAVTGDCVFDKVYQYGDDSRHYGAERRMAEELTRHFQTGEPSQCQF